MPLQQLRVNSFDDLAAEGQELLDSVSPSEATKPISPVDNTICRRGPCVHFIATRFPTGIQLSDQSLDMPRYYCRAGVVFPETRADPKTSLIIGSNVTLPTDCSMWSPITEAEIAAQSERRLEAQDRIAFELAQKESNERER